MTYTEEQKKQIIRDNQCLVTDKLAKIIGVSIYSIRKWRKKFGIPYVKLNDDAKKRAFLVKHQFLTNMEIGQMVGVSVKTVQRWRKKFDLPKKIGYRWGGAHDERPACFKQRPYTSYKTPVDIIEDKKKWDNKEFFHEMYIVKGYGMVLIGRMIQKDVFIVKQKLKKYGIKIRSYAESMHSKNRCCNRKWLEENYEIQGKTIVECAKMAGVNEYTIMNWLVKFGIPIRDQYECIAGELNKNYGKRVPQLHDRVS